jgi:dTDP-4-dehydrorhamnose 3,5-epimerase
MNAPAYPDGVLVRPLKPNLDVRGSLTEIHRDEWSGVLEIVQWNVVRSRANTLRGLHAHVDRWEIYILVAGRAYMTIRDIRPGSATLDAMATLEVDAEQPCAVQIPPGVLHGTYFREAAVLAIGFSAYYVDADEFGCQWNDPQAGFTWPCTAPILSPRDAALPSYAELLRLIAATAGTAAK